MHHLRHINRQKLLKLIKEQRIEVNEQLGYEDVDYGAAVGIAEADILRENYPSKNCGEIVGSQRYRRIR